MDLSVSIRDGHIATTLYEKPLNLHLYIPPHSAHPPGLLPGIVFGTLFRIYTLCTEEQDKMYRTKIFFDRLIARGYKSDNIKPLFYKAIATARAYTGPTATDKASNSVIFHLPYHPGDPPSYEIQKTWRSTVMKPPYKMAFSDLKNPKTNTRNSTSRLIIAYKRPMNLGNMLSHRILPTSPLASSFYLPD